MIAFVRKLGPWLGVLAVMAFVGCKGPSAEDAEKQWHSTTEEVQKYAAKYPGMKTALDDLLTSGKKDFEAAKTADEESRGKKMQAVNERVSSSLAVFKTYETEADKLKKLMSDKDLQNLPASTFNPVNDKAKAAVAAAEAALKDSKAANMGEAKAALETAIKALKDASAAFEALKPKKPAAGGSTASPAGTSAATSSPASTAAATASPAGTAAPK